jgi:Leucine-rich repeat (LRR) protein
MRQATYHVLGLCLVALLCTLGHADDMSALRAILDANSSSLYVDSIATFEAGRITRLDLSNQDFSKEGLKTLPPDIGQLTACVELLLNDNDLTSLPTEIGNLTALVRLEIKDNHLTALPGSIGNLSELRELELRNNELETLPEGITQLKVLNKLHLWGNELKELPATVGEMEGLRELYLKGNELSSLPESMHELELTYIDHEGNHLCTLTGPLDEWMKKVTRDPKYVSWQKCADGVKRSRVRAAAE